MFRFFKPKQKPQKTLVVLGTDFGSYQFNQLVEISDMYRVAGFISDDSWQKKSAFGKIGVFNSSEIKELCQRERVDAIILPSDQKEIWLKEDGTNPLEGLESLVKHCDILTIQQNISSSEANQFLSNLIST